MPARPSVLVRAEDQTLLERIAGHLPGVEFQGSTETGTIPRSQHTAIILAAHRLDALWFESAAAGIETLDEWAETIIVMPTTADNVRRIAMLPPVRLVLMSELEDGALGRTLSEITAGWRAEQGRERILELLRAWGGIDELLEPTSVGNGSGNGHAGEEPSAADPEQRWKDEGMPGTFQELLDHVLILRFAWAVEDGNPPKAVARNFEISTAKAEQLAMEVAGCSAAELTSERVWVAIEAWAAEG